MSDRRLNRLQMRTQIGIVGAGPAGLLLSQMLHLRGIDSVVLENKSREHCETRIRAGVLENGTVDLLIAAEAGERLQREALIHRGIHLRVRGSDHRIDFPELTGGKTIAVYAQQEVVKDLIVARLKAGGSIFFEVEGVRVHELSGPNPAIRFRNAGEDCEVRCDFIAGCDGFHGVCRPSIPAGVLTTFEKVYPFAWLGILARAAPSSEELVYIRHDRGFALHSMRTPEITRLYLQCRPDEDLNEWPDERIWQELHARSTSRDGRPLNEGPILQKGITGMRSFLVDPMQYGKLFLLGDAAHIVPPTGAKGLNLAAADVRVFAHALNQFYRRGERNLLDRYSEVCLRRVWQAQRFSAWMTTMLHRSDESEFAERLHLAELDFVASSRAAATTLAENYVGLPFEPLPE
jgi:p-hydroxybenzoate 3-monooxygenase